MENAIMKDTDIVSVKNRSNSVVGYSIPELNVNRNFAKGEVKKIEMKELRQLSYQPGGDVLLRDYLVVEAAAAANELVPGAEIEYNYDEAKVREILAKGSLDELLDTLDFGPDGVKDLIKNIAVETKLNDVAKRDAIKEKTGFDVTKAIEINKADAEDDTKAETTKQRRVTPAEEKATPVVRRRVVTKSE